MFEITLNFFKKNIYLNLNLAPFFGTFNLVTFMTGPIHFSREQILVPTAFVFLSKPL